MATVEELRSAVRESLERRGVLAATRARLRAEVFTSLAEPETARPPLPHENLLLNELIHEYLSYNQYNYTAGVLVTEAGQPDTRLERDFLARELHVLEEPSARSVPLLYGMLAHFMSRGAGVNASQSVPMPGGSRGLQRAPSPSRVPQKIATAGDTGVEEPAMTQFVVRGGYR